MKRKKINLKNNIKTKPIYFYGLYILLLFFIFLVFSSSITFALGDPKLISTINSAFVVVSFSSIGVSVKFSTTV